MEYGLVFIEEGIYEQAIQALNKALTLVGWDPDLWNYLGVAYWKSGQPEKAIEVYEKALALDPTYAVVLTNLATSEMSLALKNRDRQLLDKAEVHFKKLLKLIRSMPRLITV
jgi:Flp pilus assembly protein TadD, contains TPR repeats